MRGTGSRHLDSRRLLRPLDYLADPWSFGAEGAARTQVPAGGDEVSRLVAELQHRLVAAWRAGGGRPSAGALCARFEMSKQTWSRVTLGQRWAGETVLAALMIAVTSRSGAANPRPARAPYGRGASDETQKR